MEVFDVDEVFFVQVGGGGGIDEFEELCDEEFPLEEGFVQSEVAFVV
jgi:hypothetical protein